MAHVCVFRLHCRSALTLAVFLLCASPAARAQNVVVTGDGTVTIKAADVELGRLLRDFAALHPFEKLTIDPQLENRPVTLTLDRVTVRDALIAILDRAEANYLLVADPEGHSVRVVAQSRDSLSPIPPADISPSGESTVAIEELDRALNAPRTRLSPGAIVELPFPGPDGTPLFTAIPDGPVNRAVPFADGEAMPATESAPIATAGKSTRRKPSIR